MPDYGSYDTDSYDTAPSAGDFDAGALDSSTFGKAAQMTQPQGYGAFTTVVGDAALGVSDLVDTVGSSLGMINRGDFNDGMLNMVGIPGVRDFYNQNRGGIEVASAIYGIIGAEMVTGGLVNAAAPFVAGMRAGSWAKKALSLDSQYTAAIANVAKVDTQLGLRGLQGAELYTRSVPILPEVAGLVGPTAPTLFTRAAVSSKARLLGAVKGGLRAGATEAVMGATLHSNSFLYSEDESANVAFAAVGIGLGAGFGMAGATYAMRKFAASDQMQRINAAALDPTGLEQALLDPTAVVKGVTDKQPTYLGSLGGSITDKITALRVRSAAAPGDAVDRSTASGFATQLISMANDEIQKFTIKGFRGVNGSGFSRQAEGYGNHIRQILSNDEGAFLQGEMIAGAGGSSGMSVSKIVEEHTQNITDRFDKLSGLMQDKKAWNRLKPDAQLAYQKELKQLKWQQTHVPVPYIDGEATTLSHAASYDNWVEPAVATKSEEGLSTWQSIDKSSKSPHGVGIDNDMSLYLPNGTSSVNDLTYFDSLRLYRTADQAINDTLKNPKGVLKLPENPNWFQLDMAEEMLKRSKGAGRVEFPGTMTRESAQIESFAQKVDAIKAGARSSDPTDIMKMRVKFNLPKLTAYEVGLLGTSEHPLDMIVRGAIAKGGGDAVRGMQLPELLDGITQASKISDLQATSARNAKSLTGNTFNFMKDADGVTTNPMVMMKRPFAPQEFIKDNLVDRLAARKIDMMKDLTGPQADDLTKLLTGNVLSSPDYALASKVSGLSETQAQAVIPGLANDAMGQGGRAVTDGMSTAEWKFRDTPQILAITRSRENAERVTQNYMRTVFESNLGDILPRLNGPRSLESKTLLDQFHTHAQGWHIAEQPLEITLPSGKKGFQFVLDDVVENQERFESQFGRKMNPGEALPNAQGKPMVLDELGMEAQLAFNKISDVRRVQQNVLKNALQLPETRRGAWYVPAPAIEGKIVGHTYDPLGRIVSGGTVIADTQEQFTKMVSRLKDGVTYPNNPLLREGHEFRPQQMVQEYATAMDRAQQEMVNPGRTFIAPGKSNLGKNQGQEFNPSAFTDSMTVMRDGFMEHGREVHALMYDDVIKAAKGRSAISGGQIPGNLSDTQKQASKNIYDHFVDAATGRSSLSSDKSWWGRKYNEIEGSANKQLAWIDPTIRKPMGFLAGKVRDYYRQANPYTSTQPEKEAFEQMARDLGAHSPFETAAQMIESRGLGQRPVELAKITGDLNQFEATWMLRMLEPVQAAMNLTGMVNAMPAVMRHVSRKVGESIEEHAARVGHSASVFEDGSGGSVGMIDMGKVMLQGFKRSWNRAADADFDRLSQKGLLDFQMAEFRKAFNAADGDRSAFKRFISGDPASDNKFAQKGLTGWLSVMTDKSEDFSRSWGLFSGLELANKIGIKGDMADDFAHDMANKMIANYAPQNRAEMFQGPVGAPIGLFQSFVISYYQRLFRYAETGDMGALGVQYATQAGMFGLKTVPGFQEMNQMFLNNTDGKESPYDSMVKRFGESAGNILMGGVIGNIPALFGGPSHGVDLTTRGDTSYRAPTLDGFPVFTTGKKIFEGVGQAMQLFGKNNPDLTGTQLAELAANTIPNRPIAGLIEQFAGGGGNDTDGKGALISKSDGWMESMYRIMGTRSQRQSKEIEAFYANKGAQEIHANQLEMLNRNTRSIIRGEHSTMDDLPDVFDSFVAGGGDPKNYKRWIKGNFETATETRGEKQLSKMMGKPQYEEQANRLLDAGVTLSDEEAVSDDYMGSPADPMDNETPTNSFADNSNMMYGTNGGM